MLLGWGQGSSELHALGTRILGATCFGVWNNLDQSCLLGKCWLSFGTPLILDIASSISKMMSQAWNAANWTPAGGPITSLWYVCMYACDKNFVNFFKIGAYNFNTYRMVKVTCRLMHWVPLLGPLGPLGKAYHMAETASQLIHFFRSYTQNWADDVIIWDNSARSKNWMGQVHHTVILRWNGWYIRCYPWRSGKCVGFAFVSMAGTNFHDS